MKPTNPPTEPATATPPIAPPTGAAIATLIGNANVCHAIKLDGILAQLDLDGNFVTKSGKPIPAPKWWRKKNLPKLALLKERFPPANGRTVIFGELHCWNGDPNKLGDNFAAAQRAISASDDDLWKQLGWMPLDVIGPPLVGMTLPDRIAALHDCEIFGITYYPPQPNNCEYIAKQAAQAIKLGAEGIVLRDIDKPLTAKEASRVAFPHMWKIKRHDTAEASVTKINPLNKNILHVREILTGKEFRLTLRDRSHILSPPAKGEIIEFSFQGRTELGTPRHAQFLRVRSPDTMSA